LPKKFLPEHTKDLKPLLLSGRIEKISGMGYSIHKRLLKLDTNSLTYYKSIPVDYEDMKTNPKSLSDMGLIRKASLPLDAIFSV